MELMAFDQFISALESFLARRIGTASDKLHRKLSAGWDGDAFCVLVGSNLQEGEGFFAPTEDEAMKAFLATMLTKEVDSND